MIDKTNKTVEEYTVEFEKDYQKIVNNGQNYMNSQNLNQNLNKSFEIYTVYTDNTPVTASSSSTIVVKL